MKFPKSMHAEGWASHLEETRPEHLPDALKPARPAVGPAGLKPKGAGAKISIHAPLDAAAAAVPRVEPAFVRPRPNPTPAAAIQRGRPMSWMFPVGAGVALVAAVAMGAMQRPSEAPVPSPILVAGGDEPRTEVAAAAAPVTPRASGIEDGSSATVAAAPAPVAPAPRLGALAQAPMPAARPDMVSRAAPTPVAAAPADALPRSLPPGSAPIAMPPTAAGLTAVDPLVMPLASATPDATSPAATGTPRSAQAQPAQALPEDGGITAQVRLALAADATLAVVPIAVSTDHGVVKLEGQVPDAPTRERAAVVASSTAGVKAVDNRLTLPTATVVGQAPSSPE